MSLQEGQLGRLSWLPATLLITVLIVSLVGGYYFWQRSELIKAGDALGSGNFEEAFERADRMTRFAVSRDYARGLRAQALIKLDPSRTDEALAEFSVHADLGDHPQIGLVALRSKLDQNDLEGIEPIITSLAESQSGNPDFLFLKTRIHRQLEDLDSLRQTTKQILAIDPNHHQALLLQAKMLLAKNTPVTAIQAKSALRRAAANRGEPGLEALKILATNNQIPLFHEDREWLLDEFERRRAPEPLVRLLISTQRIAIDPEAREEIIAATIQENGSEVPQLVSEWLMAIGAYEQLNAFLQSEESRELEENRRWLARLKALIAKGDVASANELVENGPEVLSSASRAALLAYISTNQENIGEPTASWRNAFAVVSEQRAYSEMMALGTVAQNQGWVDDATRAYDAALEMAPANPQKFVSASHLLMIYLQTERTEVALALVNRMLEIEPENPVMRNNQYYLEALVEDFDDIDPHRISDLAEQSPNSIYSSTYAFNLWNAGLYEEAWEQFKNVDQQLLNVPSCRLVGALTAMDAGEMAIANQLLESLQSAQLLPEEVTLYETALSRSETSSETAL